jgi:predicted nicotinamide N-methyase
MWRRGGGLVAIAAALAGARHVTANEIDPYADARRSR